MPPPPTDEDDGWTFCAFANEYCQTINLGVAGTAANAASDAAAEGNTGNAGNQSKRGGRAATDPELKSGSFRWPPPPPAGALPVVQAACMRFGARVDGGLFTYQIIRGAGATCAAKAGKVKINPAPKLPKHCWVGPVTLCRRLLRLEMETPGRESGGGGKPPPPPKKKQTKANLNPIASNTRKSKQPLPRRLDSAKEETRLLSALQQEIEQEEEEEEEEKEKEKEDDEEEEEEEEEEEIGVDEQKSRAPFELSKDEAMVKQHAMVEQLRQQLRHRNT